MEITLIFQRAETHIHPKSRSQRKTHADNRCLDLDDMGRLSWYYACWGCLSHVTLHVMLPWLRSLGKPVPQILIALFSEPYYQYRTMAHGAWKGKKKHALRTGCVWQPKERIYPKIRPLSWTIIHLYRFKCPSLDAWVCIAIQYLPLMEGCLPQMAIWRCGKIQGCLKWSWNPSNTVSKSMVQPVWNSHWSTNAYKHFFFYKPLVTSQSVNFKNPKECISSLTDTIVEHK